MPDYRAVEGQLTHALSLNRRPVAVAFRNAPPPGVLKFIGIEPSGCSFWRLAAAERAFYTVPADHHNCPIGSYTHNIALPPERAAELPQTLSLMTGLGYLKMEEVPGFPRLPESPGVVIYAPLGDSPVDPDVSCSCRKRRCAPASRPRRRSSAAPRAWRCRRRSLRASSRARAAWAIASTPTWAR